MTLTRSHLRTIELASRYVAILAAVEQAHANGWDEEVSLLLAEVDPVDCRYVAQDLQTIFRDQNSAEVSPHATAVVTLASAEHLSP